jgi:site-specific DNA-methyltransferase (adenine-specific)
MTANAAGRSRHPAPTEPDRPALYGDLRSWALVQADSLAFLASLPDACVDAVVTDPPYGLAFNGAAWDSGALAEGHGFQAFSTSWAREVRRVLRPGGYLTCFGATRTFHRLASGVEDAGMEIRDQLLWLHGRGVPKAGQLPGGRSTSLKPAYEPILLARAPLPAGFTVRQTLERHGTGALNIAATRLPRAATAAATSSGGGGQPLVGYWPSHLILGHQPDCQTSKAGPNGTAVVQPGMRHAGDRRTWQP